MGEKMHAARMLLQAHAVLLRPHAPFTYASGLKSPIYCDNRILLSHPTQRAEIMQAFEKIAAQISFDVIAGTATAGIAWAAMLAQTLNKPLVYVRKASKGYGQQKRIEGELTAGQRVLVVEDLISTGASALDAIEAVRAQGCTVTDCIAIFTYNLHPSAQGFTSAACALHALTDLNALLTLAEQTQVNTPEECTLVRTWQAHPEEWT